MRCRWQAMLNAGWRESLELQCGLVASTLCTASRLWSDASQPPLSRAARNFLHVAACCRCPGQAMPNPDQLASASLAADMGDPHSSPEQSGVWFQKVYLYEYHVCDVPVLTSCEKAANRLKDHTYRVTASPVTLWMTVVVGRSVERNGAVE